MNRDEIVDLLSLIAARDNRNVGQTTVAVWLEDLGDIEFGDARRAIAEHFRESSDWLMPAHIRERVKATREARLGPPGPGLSPIPPPADPDDPKAYMAALREQQARIAAGVEEVPAIEAGASGGYESSPHAQRIIAEFKATQVAAERRRAQEAERDRQHIRAYVAAVEQLLELPDRGARAMAVAREELLGDDQAVQGYPLLAITAGVHDEHKVAVRAAWLVAEGRA